MTETAAPVVLLERRLEVALGLDQVLLLVERVLLPLALVSHLSLLST